MLLHNLYERICRGAFHQRCVAGKQEGVERVVGILFVYRQTGRGILLQCVEMVAVVMEYHGGEHSRHYQHIPREMDATSAQGSSQLGNRKRHYEKDSDVFEPEEIFVPYLHQSYDYRRTGTRVKYHHPLIAQRTCERVEQYVYGDLRHHHKIYDESLKIERKYVYEVFPVIVGIDET